MKKRACHTCGTCAEFKPKPRRNWAWCYERQDWVWRDKHACAAHREREEKRS